MCIYIYMLYLYCGVTRVETLTVSLREEAGGFHEQSVGPPKARSWHATCLGG